MKFKKYSGRVGNLFFWLANLITLAMLYPATLRNIEAENKLLGTTDFLSESIHIPGGILFVVETWLQQWFTYPWIGAAITASIATLCSLLIGTILRIEQIRISSLFGIVWSGVILSVGFPEISTLLQICVALALFSGYYQMKIHNKSWYISILALCFYPIIGTESTVSLFLGMLLVDISNSIQIRSWIISAIGLILVVCIPDLWSKYIFYLNEEQRKLIDFSDIQLWSIMILPVVVWLNGKIKKHPQKFYNLKIEWGCHLLAAFVFPGNYFIHKDTFHTQEEFYQMEQSAEIGDWNAVLKLANSKRPEYSDLHLRYALLAENELGTLADHLFFYPVNSTTDLFFWRQNEENESLFNGLFYKSVGVADEYMHQIFEMGTSTRGGMSARTIRHLTEAAIMQEDKMLANKFYTIALKSQKEEPWTTNTGYKLKTLNQKNIDKNAIPERSDFFIGSYTPKTEFIYMAQNDSNNIKRINLMLCSLLLEKDLPHFQKALVMYQGLFRNYLPTSYAEAYLLLTMANQEFKLPLNISNAKIHEWEAFLQLLNQNRIDEINRQYPNSYWFYYLYKQVKELQ